MGPSRTGRSRGARPRPSPRASSQGRRRAEAASRRSPRTARARAPAGTSRTGRRRAAAGVPAGRPATPRPASTPRRHAAARRAAAPRSRPRRRAPRSRPAVRPCRGDVEREHTPSSSAGPGHGDRPHAAAREPEVVPQVAQGVGATADVPAHVLSRGRRGQRGDDGQRQDGDGEDPTVSDSPNRPTRPPPSGAGQSGRAPPSSGSSPSRRAPQGGQVSVMATRLARQGGPADAGPPRCARVISP